MKIAIIQPRASYYLGGGEVVALEQAKQYILTGNDVTLFTTKQKKMSQKYIDFATQFPDRVIEVDTTSFKDIYNMEPGQNWFRWDIESLYFAVALNRHSMFVETFDVYLYHNLLDSLSTPRPDKTLVHLHGFPEELGYIHHLALYDKKYFISDSKVITNKWQSMTLLDHVVIIPNGVDTEKFQPKDQEKTIDFLSVGRLIEIKGINYLIDAIKILSERGERPRVVIAGDGPYLLELQKMAINLDNIEWLGRVSDDKLIDLYQKTKYLVLPSYSREGIMTTLLEAAACGTPAIVTTGSSMMEFVNKETGLSVKPKDSADLATVMHRALSSNYVRLGKNARVKIEASWGWPQRTMQRLEAMKQWF